MTAELRAYQIEVIEKCREEIKVGNDKIIIVAPTGSGKTIVAGSIIKSVVAKDKRALVLAHTREIIGQTSAKLAAEGIDHGIIQAGFAPRDAAVQIATVQTLSSRAMRSRRMELPAADLLIVDECQHSTAATWRKIIESYPQAVLIGLTATPCRGDGRGLGGIFDAIVECPQVAELIAQGYLVGTRVYAPAEPDLTGIRTRAGDYVEQELAQRMDKDELVGDIVQHYFKYGERRKTVCFAVNVAHSIHICEEFKKAGVRAEHIDGSTPKPERDAALARLASGETEVVTNCMVLTEGWDLPAVACCILARPTKQMGLYRQMVGRVLRPAPGKTNAIVLDHAGATYRHGFVEDKVEWTLDPDRRAESKAHAARQADGYRSRFVDCTSCGSIRVAGERCGHCGHLPQRRGDAVEFRDGDLALVGRKSRRAEMFSDPAERLRWYSMLAHIAEERGYKPGWASHKYKERFHTWPLQRHPSLMEPTPEVLSWVRSRNIAWAKRKAAA
ncbi:MAG: DEAD/DEAH box helicase [Xanthobacteraceae bacterium]